MRGLIVGPRVSVVLLAWQAGGTNMAKALSNFRTVGMMMRIMCTAARPGAYAGPV